MVHIIRRQRIVITSNVVQTKINIEWSTVQSSHRASSQLYTCCYVVNLFRLIKQVTQVDATDTPLPVRHGSLCVALCSQRQGNKPCRNKHDCL